MSRHFLTAKAPLARGLPGEGDGSPLMGDLQDPVRVTLAP